jgi:hypothetical protein
MFLLLFLSYSEKNKTVFYRVKEPNHEQTESGHLDTPVQVPHEQSLARCLLMKSTGKTANGGLKRDGTRLQALY